ncbi:hypothetical protein C2S52_010115 [Perilla frutescens var. hirtella]|nr:hypothetical protein C2S52_010115 [Perilla frutescens var. hirtella]
MAKANLIFTCASLLLLIFSSEIIISTQGRPLINMSNCKKCSIHDDLTSNDKSLLEISHNKPLASKDEAALINDELAAESADFRPTTPGHSPGVGHATGPSSTGPDV